MRSQKQMMLQMLPFCRLPLIYLISHFARIVFLHQMFSNLCLCADCDSYYVYHYVCGYRYFCDCDGLSQALGSEIGVGLTSKTCEAFDPTYSITV